jgi:hypothetical protein
LLTSAQVARDLAPRRQIGEVTNFFEQVKAALSGYTPARVPRPSQDPCKVETSFLSHISGRSMVRKLHHDSSHAATICTA